MITMNKNEKAFLMTYRSLQTIEHLEFLLESAKSILAYLKTQTEAQRPITIANACRCRCGYTSITQICQKLMKLKVVERVFLRTEIVETKECNWIWEGGKCRELPPTIKEKEVEVYGYILTDRNFSFDD
jgi:hypothetical protein